MSWNQHQINLEGGLLSHYQRSLLSSSSPSPSPSPSLPDNSDYQKQSSSGSRISPAVIFIIVILAVIFFISGLVHLLVRFLIKHRSSSSLSESNRFPDMSGSGAFQRQLQQLFHLHDSGLDQAFIDALPVFLYKDIVGLKEPFDCAVCLCEFSEKDRLRLLPLCSHAFHVDCIDTWLLSNSTCPLCRGTLFTPGFPIENPVFYLEEQREEDICSINTANAVSISQKPTESEIIHSKRVFSVRLGKFRSSNGGVGEKGEGETSSSNMEARRCYSMGSYQYVVADLDLQVALCPSRGATGAVSLNIGKGRSGQGGNSSIEGDIEGKKINIRSKGESFSVSKIWQWSRKGKFPSSSENHTGPSSVTVSFPWNDDHTQDTRW